MPNVLTSSHYSTTCMADAGLLLPLACGFQLQLELPPPLPVGEPSPLPPPQWVTPGAGEETSQESLPVSATTSSDLNGAASSKEQSQSEFEADPLTANAASSSSSSSQSRKKTQAQPEIVIVDDSSEVRITLEDVLTRLGYRVRAFRDGESFLSWLYNNTWFNRDRDYSQGELERSEPVQVSLILMDIEMPGANGFEVNASLKQHPATAKLPVVLMSGDDTYSTQAQVELSSLGLHGVLAKPFRLSQLRELLDITTTTHPFSL